jgi:two-component system OmpR family response regulator
MEDRSPHLLVVEDDREIRDLVARFLTKHGFRASVAADGRAMDKVLDTAKINLVVLDVMLPGGEDGLALCRRLRADSSVPIVLLTALAEETDRIIGLELGADDYVTKPFSPRELLARIRAVLRRAPGQSLGGAPAEPSRVLAFNGWEVDLGRRHVYAPDRTRVSVTSGEFDLLVAFCDHPRRVLSRDQLLDLTHGRAPSAFDRSVDIQVSRLRHKIEADPKNPEMIQTVRSNGYFFAPEVSRS